MSTNPNSPRLVKGGLVLLDPDSGVVRRVIALQYNPDTLSRTVTPRSAADADGHADINNAFRLKGPPTETIKLEAELDATDQMEAGDRQTADAGVAPALAALETIIYPTSGSIQQAGQLAGIGTLEISPAQGPLVLFVWSRHRVVPVRLTELSITEEAFDPNLNPTRAKVSLGLRVLTSDDLGLANKGGSLFLIHLQQKEALAARSLAATLPTLGIGAIP